MLKLLQNHSVATFWQYYIDEPVLNNPGSITDFPDADNSSALFNFFYKIVGQTGNYGTNYVKIMVPLKYKGNFWRTLKMSLVNCENNLILTWFANSFIIANPANNQVLKLIQNFILRL